MQKNNKFSKLHFFEKLSSHVTRVVGSHAAIVFAFSILILWLIWGPFENFSDHWHLMIHTIASTITFLMVFIIQKSHNKDSLAIQLKLNELISAHSPANNILIDVENMTEEELKIIQKYYSKLSVVTTIEDKQKYSKWGLKKDAINEIKKEMDTELFEQENKKNVEVKSQNL